jgi:exopolysaccharide biosynthesis polyprenyl glycosylphosphotransferase
MPAAEPALLLTPGQLRICRCIDWLVSVFSLRILHRFVGAQNLSFLRSQHGTRWRLWDFLVGIATFWLGFYLSPHTERMPAGYYLVLVGGLYGLVLAVWARLCGVPSPGQRTTNYELFTACVLAVVLSYITVSFLVSLVLVRAYGRYIVFTTMCASMLGLLLPRYWLLHLIRLQPLAVALYGASRTGIACARRMAECVSEFRLVGYLDSNRDLLRKEIAGAPVLGNIHEFDGEKLREFGVDVVVICVGKSLVDKNAAALLNLPLHGIDVLTMGAFIERYFKEITLEYECPHWFASAPSVPGNPSIFAAKRVLDLVVSVPLLLATLPFWPLLALLIKLDSPGPVLFKQTRVGRFRRPFTILKFRTMRADAEKNGAQWAEKNDPRVTRLGNLLRVTRIDELPQLWNVIRGEMSVVGPRPERPEFVTELAQAIPFYEQRHLVPPGLTGWAQIRYRYGASREDARKKLEFDLYYVRHLSLGFDLEILLKTVPLVMRGSR